jgi:hypothetical protein
MRELKLTLDFTCSICEGPVSVTVQCRGNGLGQGGFAAEADGDERGVAVNVPCPTCGQINRLTFDASGQVRSVKPMRCFRMCPEPSVN